MLKSLSNQGDMIAYGCSDGSVAYFSVNDEEIINVSPPKENSLMKSSRQESYLLL